MEKYREEEIEKAKEKFDREFWICFDGGYLFSEAFRRLENYGLITLSSDEARLGPLGMAELNKFIETGKTKLEREQEEEGRKLKKLEKREVWKIYREWVLWIIAIWGFIRTFK